MVIKIGECSLVAASITGWSVAQSGRELFVFAIGAVQPFIFTGPAVPAFLATMEKVYPQQVGVVEFAARLAALEATQPGEVQGEVRAEQQAVQAVHPTHDDAAPPSPFSDEFVRRELQKTMGGEPPEEVVQKAMEFLRKQFDDATRPPAKPGRSGGGSEPT